MKISGGGAPSLTRRRGATRKRKIFRGSGGGGGGGVVGGGMPKTTLVQGLLVFCALVFALAIFNMGLFMGSHTNNTGAEAQPNTLLTVPKPNLHHHPELRKFAAVEDMQEESHLHLRRPPKMMDNPNELMDSSLSKSEEEGEEENDNDGVAADPAAGDDIADDDDEKNDDPLKEVRAQHDADIYNARHDIHETNEEMDEMTEEEMLQEAIKKHAENVVRQKDTHRMEDSEVGVKLDEGVVMTVPNVIYTKNFKVLISAWLYMEPTEEELVGQKTIFAMGAEDPNMKCYEDNSKATTAMTTDCGVMVRLYVNHENTADEELILEYSTDGKKLERLEGVGAQVPIHHWTHVAFMLYPDDDGNRQLAKLFIDGEMVGESDVIDGDKQENKNQQLNMKEYSTMMIGRARAYGNGIPLYGRLSQLAIWTDSLPPIDDRDFYHTLRASFESGYDESMNDSRFKPDYLYPLSDVKVPTADDETKSVQIEEVIQSKHGNIGLPTRGKVELSTAVELPPAPFNPYDQLPEEINASPDIIDTDIIPPNDSKTTTDPEEDNTEPIIPAPLDIASYKPLGGERYVEYINGTTPKPITPRMIQESNKLARTRRIHIKNAMKHAWDGYKTYAFGYDELKPDEKKGHNCWGGMGTTLVDSLDTLWLMGMKEEFWEGRDWVRDHLNHDHVGFVSVFETTIRSLGGLLSAYDWSGDPAFLEKANDLGGRLAHAFESPSGLAYSQTQLNGHNSKNAGWQGTQANIAEFGTLQVEFRYLAKLTNQPHYADDAMRAYELMHELQPDHGLFPIYVRNDMRKPAFTNTRVTFGAMGDSFYEYLLKTWLQGGKRETKYREMYDKAMDGVANRLIQTSTPSGLTYMAEGVTDGPQLVHKMDHLVCFMGGSLALGAYTDPDGLDSPRAQRDLKLGKALAYTCYQMYARMTTGIAPEIVKFYDDMDFEKPRDAAFYILRPETVETFFILNQLTGDPVYREWGWEIFQSIEKYCKKEVGYGGLRDVGRVDQPPENRMESFFLAETLKYLYLLMDPDTEVDILNKHVFNTEAHPTRMFPVIDEEHIIEKTK